MFRQVSWCNGIVKSNRFLRIEVLSLRNGETFQDKESSGDNLSLCQTAYLFHLFFSLSLLQKDVSWNYIRLMACTSVGWEPLITLRRTSGSMLCTRRWQPSLWKHYDWPQHFRIRSSFSILVGLREDIVFRYSRSLPLVKRDMLDIFPTSCVIIQPTTRYYQNLTCKIQCIKV